MTTTTLLAAYPGRYFAAWNGRDLDAVAPILADAFHWTDPLLPAPLEHLDAAHGFFTGSWGAFPDLRFELIGEPLVDEAAARVAQEWRMLGTHSGEFPPLPVTGKPFDVTGTDVFTVDEDGRATVVRAYYDALGLMRQLGLA
ncbi:polyketide cyclase [Conexibacter sp. W3-3-2]|uniref:Polyketide cyclase n=1 Tax=Paraconexibacter algicola TaxID=2133960 RepID=A0A2T4UJV3_9ACTN|nr:MULTISPECIES: ester cyclase [Solirubrobacterales]MTD45842.1 polyketide cyclase [Conexibacter sp. W3-3-2]PTL59495.1 polyketide cyclase [Paraconexibacter algicola]